ncbi:MAG: hypothetical protein ACFHXK_12225 [bacterium]
MKQITKQTVLMILVAGLAAGCMTSNTTQAPTHRWESTTAADEVQYRNDHARCQQQADAQANSRAFEADSETFVTYKQCMVNRGYELTAYAGQE